MNNKKKTLREYNRLSIEDQALLLLATQKYRVLCDLGEETIIPADIFISSGFWRKFLTDPRVGLA